MNFIILIYILGIQPYLLIFLKGIGNKCYSYWISKKGNTLLSVNISIKHTCYHCLGICWQTTDVHNLQEHTFFHLYGLATWFMRLSLSECVVTFLCLKLYCYIKYLKSIIGLHFGIKQSECQEETAFLRWGLTKGSEFEKCIKCNVMYTL